MAPALNAKTEGRLSDKFDVIFHTFHAAAPNSRVLRPEDMKCVEELRKKAKNGKFHRKPYFKGISLRFSTIKSIHKRVFGNFGFACNFITNTSIFTNRWKENFL